MKFVARALGTALLWLLTWTSLLLGAVAAQECQPQEWFQPTVAAALVMVPFVAFWLMVSRGRARMRWRALALVAASLGSFTCAAIEVTRGQHSLCHQHGHWAPGHQHSGEAAGDVGGLFVQVLALGLPTLLGMLGCLLFVLSFFVAKRHSGAPAPASGSPLD